MHVIFSFPLEMDSLIAILHVPIHMPSNHMELIKKILPSKGLG
jgi:hypothetical protein